MIKRLYRSTHKRVLAGVLSGLADYYGHDMVTWRLGFIILLILTGLMPGILMYIAAWVIIPEAPIIEPLDQADYQVREG